MKYCIYILLFLCCLIPSKKAAAQDLHSDTLAVRAILDSNGVSNSVLMDTIIGIDPTINRVTSLRLRTKEFTVLPSELGKLTALKALDIPNSGIKYIPEEIGNLTQLEDIYAIRSGLKHIPSSICNCSMLRSLYINENEIDSLPKDIGNLKGLVFVIAYINKIQNLPASIVQCTSLVWLELGDNQIDSIPENIHHIPNLTKLHLSHNKIRTIPDSLGFTPKLNNLLLNYNELTTLPDLIVNLKPTEGFNIRFNHIDRDKLPPDVREWADKYDPGFPYWWHTQTLTSIDKKKKNIADQSIEMKSGRNAGFYIKEAFKCSISVYDSKGKNILSIPSKTYAKGYYKLFQKADKPAKGSYEVIFSLPETRIKKQVFIK